MFKNKRGMFAVLPKEILAVVFFIFLGIGLWFIYSSAKAWTMSTFGLSEGATFLIGIMIVGIVLYFIRYKFPFKVG